ncbi:GNAT family N-acetyltransferase [Bosea sp. 2YAB26]|uniref:GNAT family N-acetyltransferase n=1 Tax=Bosea sp. 2YAB26 TaxID=3237478 RepID=UPI003F8FB514
MPPPEGPETMSALAERAGTPASALNLTAIRSRGERARPWHSITISSDPAALEAEWRSLEAAALVTPYQAYGWIRPFVETVGAAHGTEFRYAALRDAAGRTQAILPLALTRRNGVRFGEFIGGKHANYHMGLYAPAFAVALDTAGARALLVEIGTAIGDLDAFIFVNQPKDWQGVPNPLAQLAAGPSPSGAYKLALEGRDCEGSLRRSMSSHARKKLKNKRNRFASFGSSVLLKAETQEDIERVVSAFLSQKAARFASMGVPNPFAEPALGDFLRQGASPDRTDTPVLELYSLDLDGRCVATYVGAVQGQRFSGMATSFDMDGDLAKSSPGEILLVDLIKLKCRAGIEVFDLGVGEARYKTTVCDDRDELVDTFLPLTPKGHAFVLFSRAKRAAKRRIKSSPVALKLAQRASGWLNRNRTLATDDD